MNLTSIDLPISIQTIYNYAFYNCLKLQSIELPVDMSKIYHNTFNNCASFTSITIPKNVTYIDENAFFECNHLQYVNLPLSISFIHATAFRNCSGVISYNIPEENQYYACYDNSLYTKNFSILLFGSGGNSNHTNVHPNCSIIQSYAFCSANNLTSITLNDNLETIGEYAFDYCLELVSFESVNNDRYKTENGLLYDQYFDLIDVPSGISGSLILSENLSKIYQEAFYYCSKIVSLTFQSKHTSLSGDYFVHCSSLEFLNVSSLEKYDFYDNGLYYNNFTRLLFVVQKISTFKMHENTLENNADFSKCYNLKSIICSQNYVNLQASAFKSCPNLQSIELSAKTLKIAKKAFANCGKLTSIFIPESTISIETEAFFNCTSMLYFNVSINNEYYQSYDGALYSSNFSILYFGPIGRKTVEIHPNTTIISEYSFYWSDHLESISIPDHVEEIGRYAFHLCTKLPEIFFLPSSVKIIGTSALEYDNLKIVVYKGDKDLDECDRFSFQELFDEKIIKFSVYPSYKSEKLCGYNVSYDADSIVWPPIDISSPISNDFNSDATSEIDQIVTDEQDPIVSSELNPVVTLEPIPTQTPKPEIISTLTVPSDVNETTLNKELENIFSQSSNNESSDHIVIIQNANEIPFNFELKENQFIKPEDGSNIDFKGGKLNLVLPESTTVSINDDDQIDLSIKGQGTLNLKHSQKEKPSINISSKSQINGTVTIVVPDYVKSVSIDSIDMESQCSLSVNKENKEQVDLTVNKITAKQNLQATLPNLTIQKELQVYQTAELNVQNVSLDDATIQYNILSYENSNSNKPFFKGSFNNPPSTLLLNKAIENENSHPAKDEEFVLISGSFESSSCEDWLPKIDYGNTEFNSRECLNNEQLQAGENKKIAIKSISKSDDNKSKLSGGQIAGIVVGCVAGVAIIVIVIVIIIRKKNKNNSNNENDNVEVNL